MKKNKSDSSLENKIIENIYQIEKRRTVFLIFKYLFLTVILGVFSFLTFSRILNILNHQQTLDLLDLFKEDQEIIKTYFWEVMGTFYEELPKTEVIVGIALLLMSVSAIYLFIRNFPKIKNRIISIIKYRLKHFRIF